jgi:hypothetical protein
MFIIVVVVESATITEGEHDNCLHTPATISAAFLRMALLGMP